MANKYEKSSSETLGNQNSSKLFKLFIETENPNRKFMISCNPNNKISTMKLF